jgi:hypothetical protein
MIETFAFLLSTALGQSQGVPPPSSVLIVRHGFTQDGAMTDEWCEAIREWHTPASLERLTRDSVAVPVQVMEWMELIESRLPSWGGMIDSLRLPFVGIPPPDTIIVLLGIRGGNDAFSPSALTICFDLDRLFAEYGPASAVINHRRIDRFFAHEFTHILHGIWATRYGLQPETPLEIALWICLKEGLGNYRSLSEKWVDPQGELTDHAHVVLKRLEPTFVERISALEHASEEDVPHLMQGLSMGPFEQKWGALPVALWLAREAGGNDRNLRQWVEKGPWGILELARMYLPAELKTRLPGVVQRAPGE